MTTHLAEDPQPVLGRLDATSQHGVGLDSERSEHLAPRPERWRTLGFDTASPRDRCAGGEDDPGELLGEPVCRPSAQR